MDRIRPRSLRCVEDAIDREIALGSRRRSEENRIVGEPHGEAIGIGLRVGHDRSQAQRANRAQDANRDLARVQ